jgi:hypothetical protein
LLGFRREVILRLTPLKTALAGGKLQQKLQQSEMVLDRPSRAARAARSVAGRAGVFVAP